MKPLNYRVFFNFISCIFFIFLVLWYVPVRYNSTYERVSFVKCRIITDTYRAIQLRAYRRTSIPRTVVFCCFWNEVYRESCWNYLIPDYFLYFFTDFFFSSRTSFWTRFNIGCAHIVRSIMPFAG